MQINTAADDLISLIHITGSKIDKLLAKLEDTKLINKKLEAENADLKNKNQIMYNQLKEYIQELEKIRAYYVNSNNNDRR